MPDTALPPYPAEAAGAVGPLPEEHPPVAQGRVGVLLVNLGTPDATDYWSMRRYLSEFLSDRRIIELSPLIWQPILQGPILTFRPSKSGKAYKKIWMQEEDMSPLLYYTERQSDLLRDRIGRDGIVVDYAMRYGNPSIASKLSNLKALGCDRISVVALYPQYAAATTASVYDKTFEGLQNMRWQPAVRTAGPFHDDPAYIEALATSLEQSLSALDFEPEVLLMSYHGIPKSYFLKGDPYHCHCHKTTRLVRERLGWSENFCRVTFQSRFGPTEWLRPYTDETLEELAESGVKRVAVAAPAFIADCVETLEEIAIEGRETFLEAGGEQFATLPCLNDSNEAIDVLEAVARREIAGWA
ncbi:MAG: ferrochelatase [Pseudomonadota bacterium]